MTTWSRGVGQYVASETHRAAWDRKTKPGARAVIYVQGSHGTATSTLNSERADIAALTRAGFIVVWGDLSQTASQGTFGNTTAQTRIGQLRTFVQGAGSPLQAAAGKVHIFAASGGVAAALNYARANPANVASIVGLGPLVDLQDLYTNRLPQSGVTQAEVDTAYGGSVAASYATHNPSASGNQAALSGVPIKLYYSTDDPFIPPSTVTNYQSLVQAAGGTCEIQSLGAVGHTDTGLSYEGIETGDVADFFLAHP